MSVTLFKCATLFCTNWVAGLTASLSLSQGSARKSVEGWGSGLLAFYHRLHLISFASDTSVASRSTESIIKEGRLGLSWHIGYTSYFPILTNKVIIINI